MIDIHNSDSRIGFEKTSMIQEVTSNNPNLDVIIWNMQVVIIQ